MSSATSRSEKRQGASSSSTSRTSKTDWDRVDALADEEIDLSDNPELTAAMFARAVARQGLQPAECKQQVTLRIDSDVLRWFRAQGRDTSRGSMPRFARTWRHTVIVDWRYRASR